MSSVCAVLGQAWVWVWISPQEYSMRTSTFFVCLLFLFLLWKTCPSSTEDQDLRCHEMLLCSTQNWKDPLSLLGGYIPCSLSHPLWWLAITHLLPLDSLLLSEDPMRCDWAIAAQLQLFWEPWNANVLQTWSWGGSWDADDTGSN